MKQKVKLFSQEDKEQFERFYGLLMYSIDNCINAHKDLKKHNEKLNELFHSDNYMKYAGDMNEIGRLDRVLKDYLVIKIRTLFDGDQDTLSLPQFGAFLHRTNSIVGINYSRELKLIRKKYKELLKRLTAVANKIVAHAVNVEIEVMHTSEVVKSPIQNLLKELHSLLVATHHKYFVRRVDYSSNK